MIAFPLPRHGLVCGAVDAWYILRTLQLVSDPIAFRVDGFADCNIFPYFESMAYNNEQVRSEALLYSHSRLCDL